jgi:ABC-type nitrate/sulfonate/bicarbonate transport system permease component
MLKQKFTTKLIKKILLGSIPFVVILLAWILFSYFSPSSSWFIPSPLETLKTFFLLTADGTILNLILISLLNLVPPFIFALFFALIFGALMGINRTIDKIFYPFLSVIYPVPSLAWIPFVILLFGFTRETIWFVIFISSFLKIVYTVRGGVKNVDLQYVLVAKNLGFSKSKIIFEVILPAAFPQIITGIRIGFGSAWRSLIGAEMLVVTLGGLGKFIWMAQWYFDFDKVLIGIVIIAIISLIVEKLIFKKIENHTLIKWGLVHEDLGV